MELSLITPMRLRLAFWGTAPPLSANSRGYLHKLKRINGGVRDKFGKFVPTLVQFTGQQLPTLLAGEKNVHKKYQREGESKCSY
jgi:hypothetical protein